MKRVTFSILFIQLIFATFAERINGPANVRTKPKGTPIISLNDNIQVECSELKSDWYTLAINIKLTKEQYDSAIPIRQGDSLFNSKDEFIGTALTTIPDSLQSTWYSEGTSGKPERYGMDIYASTYKSNIKSESIPELQLNSILAQNKTPSKEDLSTFMNEFGFRNSGILDHWVKGYEEQMIYESTVIDPSPMDRIRFIFKASELIAIVHTRSIGEKLTSEPLIRGRKITVIKQMNPDQLVKFLEINKKAYTGVD